MPSTTRIVRTARLATDEEIASVVLRLMMAMNDIGVANDALQEWDQTQSRKKKARQNGGKLYFGRIQMAHIYEALLIIEEIKQTASLVRAVERCDIRTQRSFEAVATFLYTEDFKRLRRLRNNAAFHYDSKLGLRALHQIIEKYPGDTSSLSLGSETLDWYFELGDKVLDRLVVRQVFNVSEDENMRDAINVVLDRLHAMAVAFADFAGYFIRHYAR
jgi:hypothetical protein